MIRVATRGRMFFPQKELLRTGTPKGGQQSNQFEQQTILLQSTNKNMLFSSSKNQMIVRSLSTEERERLRSSRPTSPHLLIYRLPYCANLSFITRATGLSMTLGTSALACYAVMNPDVTPIIDYLKSSPGLLTFSKGAVSFALSYHVITGIRHMVWDRTAWGVTVPQVAQTSTMALIASLVITGFFAYYKIES